MIPNLLPIQYTLRQHDSQPATYVYNTTNFFYVSQFSVSLLISLVWFNLESQFLSRNPPNGDCIKLQAVPANNCTVFLLSTLLENFWWI